MKCLRILVFAIFIFVLSVSGLAAQSLKGMSLNGSTGLYSIPSGKIGWEKSSDLGFDLGYHTIITQKTATHIPKFALSLFKWVELSAAFDIQPEGYYHSNASDFIGGMKVQFPLKKTALALGGNFQALNIGSEDYNRHAGQVYLAVTYNGSLFDLPAETTVVIGKTFVQHDIDSDIDFGMGFDILLFPKAFESLLHWVTDFANFSYSVEAFGANARYRGVLNTGLRFDLASIPALSKFKFVIDIMVADAFDDNRAFSMGLVFGIPIL